MLTQLSYIKAYRRYANSLLKRCTRFVQIGKYADFLTRKANRLIERAGPNEDIDLDILQKDIFEEGVFFIKKFSRKFSKKPLNARKEKRNIFDGSLRPPG